MYIYELYVVYISGLNYLVKTRGVPRWNWVVTCPLVSLAKASTRESLAEPTRKLYIFDDMKSK